MSRIPTASLLLALPVTLASTPLWADLTPAEVWGDWRQYMQSMGYQVEASEAFDGADLTVSDVTLKMDMAEEGGDFSCRSARCVSSRKVTARSISACPMSCR